MGKDMMTTCKCQTRKVYLDEFWSDYCVDCGRIWVNEFTGGCRGTDRFHLIPKPLGGVWVGHTFVKGPKQLVNSLSRMANY